ncbi:MAG: protein translocase subunit SecD [Polyangiaceae bacterium]|nr:protein translocase subunit SecD [Polyangiaceae bacterium]
MSSHSRKSLLLAVACAIGAYLFFHVDNFWGMVLMGLLVVWALVTALPMMDAAWRMKVGFVATVFFGILIALWPTFEGLSHGRIRCPQYVKDRITFGIVKGLDLQGGLRLVYTVEVEEAIRDKRDRFADQMRQDLAVAYGIHSGEGLLKRDELAKLDEKVHIYEPESAVLRIKFKDPADTKYVDDRFIKKYSAELAQMKGEPGEVVFKIRADVETQIRDKAVAQAKDTVNRRVDELGLREASVTTRDEDIIVEVPGQDERTFNDIKEIIRRTARLEFKMVDDETDFFGKIPDSEVPANEGIQIWSENAPAGPGKTVKSSYARITKRENESMNDALERFKKWTSTLQVPDDHVIGFEKVEDYDEESSKFIEKGWRTFYLFSRAEVTGEYITDAQRAVNTQSGMPEIYVGITFSPTGADRFEEVTGANIQRRFAIILDDVVNSAPVIKSKIGGGRASITMGAGDPDTQLKNAEKLEMVLRSGALPAPITPSNESLIGPTLGEDSIKKGGIGAAAGMALVLLFMSFYYRKSGVVADIAVLFNLLIQLGILAAFSGTLTLPGIAGLALTVGMAVDANVLINERIREELRAGRSPRAAVDAGYDKAFSAIIDGHVTIFISGLILMQYGTGPVKGFAVTLVIGIIASLFTGVFCTRLVFDWWVRGAKVKRLSVGAEF